MGQSQGRMTTERAAEMATLMDPAPGEDDRCPEMSEQALHWMELGAKAVAKDPTPMLRASVVDLRAPARRPAADELRALLASPAAAESYAVGPPECPAGFARALLPGCVQADGWDNVPVSGYRYDVCHPEWGDEDLPYIELARAHPGDGAAPQTFPGTTAESYDNRAFAPLTTRAGGRVWSVYYAAPDGGVAALNAAYPCQILVRHDAVNRKLVLDVCDFAPTLEGRMNALYARALANPNNYAALDAVVLRHVERVLRSRAEGLPEPLWSVLLGVGGALLQRREAGARRQRRVQHGHAEAPRDVRGFASPRSIGTPPRGNTALLGQMKPRTRAMRARPCIPVRPHPLPVITAVVLKLPFH